MFLLKKKLHRVEGPVVFFQFWFFQKLKTRIDLNWHWINLKALLHPVVRGLRSCGRVPSCQAWRCLAYSERAPGVLIVAARSQRKTGRPVFRLGATRRVCDQQKKHFPLVCISLLGPFLARKPLVVPRTTGCKRGFTVKCSLPFTIECGLVPNPCLLFSKELFLVHLQIRELSPKMLPNHIITKHGFLMYFCHLL